MEANEILRHLHASLEHDARVKHNLDRIEARCDGDDVVLSGEVSSIAAKRLALEAVAAQPGVTGIVDRLRVMPAQAMGDGAIADHLQRALIGDTTFGFCEIRRSPGASGGSGESLPDRPVIEFRVEDGVITLDGEVPSLTHKRLAGVLAWWVPGSRDVINGLGVEPAEQDNDHEILDALRVVHEKDPLLDATQIHATCRSARITLQGAVRTEPERSLAEADAWALFAVDDVVNEIEVVHP
jgi:osmotically-inducible protein OsmY